MSPSSSSGAFTDKFSGHASVYAAQRPTYPLQLFQWLAAQCSAQQLAWDCGTGNGQAAVAIADHFNEVIATDASEAMIDEALADPRVRYLVSPAESVPAIRDRTIDLITVANAVHWFDLDKFYKEVRRVSKPSGVICVWCYAGSQVTPEVDDVSRYLAIDVLGDYWAPQVQFARDKYETLPFPFEELRTPPFDIEVQWNLEQYLGYKKSWSASADYERAHGRNPIEENRAAFEKAWGDAGERRPVRWQLYLRTGRMR